MTLFLSSWIIAVLIAPAAGTLGCFLVWRRMAFFAESLAHASILGLACSFAIMINPLIGIFISGVIVCLLLVAMRHNRDLPSDAWLNLIAHVMLGGGLIIISLTGIKVDLLSYLLGEWLIVSRQDVIIEGGVMLFIMLVLGIIRKPLLSATAQQEIAVAESPNDWRGDWRGNFIFLILLTLFVGVSVQTVGLILLNTLMIIPALTARHWSNNPYEMIGGSILVALVIMGSGLSMSLWLDLPASPSAAVCGGVLFALSFTLKKLLSIRNR